VLSHLQSVKRESCGEALGSIVQCRALLDTQGDFTVVRTAADGAAAIRVCRDTSPDVALVDVRVPVIVGIERPAR